MRTITFGLALAVAGALLGTTLPNDAFAQGSAPAPAAGGQPVPPAPAIAGGQPPAPAPADNPPPPAVGGDPAPPAGGPPAPAPPGGDPAPPAPGGTPTPPAPGGDPAPPAPGGVPGTPGGTPPAPGGDPGGMPPAAVPGTPGVPGAPGGGIVQDDPKRYYFDGWRYHPKTGYFYTRLHYRENHGDQQYKYHYVVCYPSQPEYAYYYDPAGKAYWGRYQYGAKPEVCFCPLNGVTGDVTSAPAETIGEPTPLGKVPGAINATANMIAPPPAPAVQ